MEQNRRTGIELLRILAMLMVVTMHYMAATGVLPEAHPGAGAQGMPSSLGILAVCLEALCIVAVNVYVLISGYFLSEKAFSFRRVGKLFLQVWFYTLLIPFVMAALGQVSFREIFDLYHLWRCLFPLEAGHYWFVTAYVVMLLASPLLNAAVKHLTRDQFKYTVFGLLFFFSVGKSFSIVVFGFDRYGYDYGWFMVLYLIGAYLRRYGSAVFRVKKRCLYIYLASAAGIALVELVSLALCAYLGILEYYVTVPFHYNFVLAVSGAIALFVVFRDLRLPENHTAEIIRRVASASFAVYLIHEHVDIAGRWAGWFGAPSNRVLGYLIQLVESVLVVFVVCILIEWCRQALFAAAGKALYKTSVGQRFEAKLHKLDEKTL